VLATVVHADRKIVEHDFLSIMNEDQEGAAGGMEEEFTIDIEKFRFVHAVILEVGVGSGNEAVSNRSKLVEEMMTKVY
jgi:hypothetical protein